MSVTLLGWLAWRTDWQQVGEAFARLRLDLWLAAGALYVASQFVSSLRWQLLARPLGLQRPYGHHVGFYFIGMYFNLFLPTSVGGDVIRAWYLDGGSGKRLAAFLSVFADRLSGLLMLLALACGAVLCSPIALPLWVQLCVWGAALAAVLGFVSLPLLAHWTRRFNRARRLMEGVRLYLTQPALLASTTFLSLVVQAANVLIVWLIGLAIDAPVPASYYWIMVPMVTLLTLLPVSLNGMGVREGGMVLFLAPLGVGEGIALSLAFLWFLACTSVALVGGAVYLLGRFPRPKGPLDDETVRGDSDQGRTGQPATVVRALAAGAGPVGRPV